MGFSTHFSSITPLKNLGTTTYFPFSERDRQEELDPILKGNMVKEPRSYSKTVTLRFLDLLPDTLIHDIRDSGQSQVWEPLI